MNDNAPEVLNEKINGLSKRIGWGLGFNVIQTVLLAALIPMLSTLQADVSSQEIRVDYVEREQASSEQRDVELETSIDSLEDKLFWMSKKTHSHPSLDLATVKGQEQYTRK